MHDEVVESVCGPYSLADSVMQYLAEHPKAMDTMEGIAEWWVMRQQVRVTTQLLAKVLDALTEKGLVEKIGSGEHARYHLKPKEA